jgi:hypothetical protein
MTVEPTWPNSIDEAAESIITAVSRDEKSDIRVSEEDEILCDEVWKQLSAVTW